MSRFRLLKTKTGTTTPMSGFTLTELVIYMMISALVMGAMLLSFFHFKRAYSKTASSYDIQKEIPIAADWLKRDLLATSLTSIRVYPDTGTSGEISGISFISPMKLEGATPEEQTPRLQISPNGTPLWSTYVFYSLVANPPSPGAVPSTPRTARLQRWEMPLETPQVVPLPTTVLPSSFATGAVNVRTIMKSVLLPGSPPIQGFDSLKLNNRDYGGFRVTFVNKKSAGASSPFTLTTTNPSLVRDIGGGGTPETSYNTDLVQVDLIALQINPGTGQPSAYAVEFQVKPRN